MSSASWSRPHRPHRPVRVGLVVAGAALGMCCVGVAGLGAWNVQAVRQADAPVRQTAEAFLTEVAAGDADRAYRRLCAPARTRWSPVGFAAWVRTPPVVTGHQVTDVSVSTRDGQPTGTVTVRLIRDGGRTEQRDLRVVREDDDWRVCGDPF
ncbi:hypothetical protein CA850_27940 [Micromonospora echinospora]|uniref:DUF4878 domain-containing protein n=1 Tax=Micromonospora echinospora TaxID=1877 RepID=A0A1C4ZGL5_MICEC|nr:hypothetical protein [Micromonospora echinospora]OZV75894.1 hypothetical protein CA850_27940 [Micromonospora echinospora]SCF31976.1 hypothetical protein GA0070618_5208 [Micromonospora echinospora]